MRALRKAIIFARQVFDIDQLEGVIASIRCLGASKTSGRSLLLTLRDLPQLHAMLADDKISA